MKASRVLSVILLLLSAVAADEPGSSPVGAPPVTENHLTRY